MTVTAPKASGIAAAIGERKTSRRTISRIGRAISSPRSLAAIDRPGSPARASAKPVWVARTGGWISVRGSRFELGDRVVDRGLDVGVEVGEDQGAPWAGPQLPDEPRSQGERVVTFGSRRRARTRAGPWRSIARARARAAGSRTGRCRRSVRRASWLAREEPVPGMSRVVGSSLPSTLAPTIPSAARISAATTSTARGWRSVNGGRRSGTVPWNPGRPCSYSFASRR